MEGKCPWKMGCERTMVKIKPTMNHGKWEDGKHARDLVGDDLTLNFDTKFLFFLSYELIPKIIRVQLKLSLKRETI